MKNLSWDVFKPNSFTQSPVPLRTTSLVLSKEGILGFWQVMNVHHLYRSLLFGFKKHIKITDSHIQYESEVRDSRLNKLQKKRRKQTIFSFFVTFLKPFSCRSQPFRVKIAFLLFSLSLRNPHKGNSTNRHDKAYTKNQLSQTELFGQG